MAWWNAAPRTRASQKTLHRIIQNTQRSNPIKVVPTEVKRTRGTPTKHQIARQRSVRSLPSFHHQLHHSCMLLSSPPSAVVHFCVWQRQLDPEYRPHCAPACATGTLKRSSREHAMNREAMINP
mmetsp:Transcript_8888/g.24019  ORF Transcript_8888/g.24019 Transcript_8888/m.24019 type:complete len:124 (+) Transcript_8888:630-1001(+)